MKVDRKEGHRLLLQQKQIPISTAMKNMSPRTPIETSPSEAEANRMSSTVTQKNITFWDTRINTVKEGGGGESVTKLGECIT